MGVRRQASGDPTLTNFARGLTQELGSAIANFLAPIVRVPSTIGQYKKFNESQDFQVYDTARAVGGAAKRIHFHAEDPAYNCQPQALEIPLDDAEADAEGNFPMSVKQAKTRTLVSSAVTGHEDKVITVAKTTSAESGLGDWGNPDVDPVAEIDATQRAIATACGRMPNRIAWGLLAWERFRNHPKVRARQPGAVLIGLNLIQAAGMFLNPAVQQKIGVFSKDLSKTGKAANKSNILGDDVFVFFAEENPTPFDPSFMKTFMGGEGGVDSVRTYRDETCRSDILAVDWSEDIEIVSTVCGRKITTTG
jgi:hypothetical protein